MVRERVENESQSERSGWVLSDLHLLAQRSVAADYLAAVHEAAQDADFIVLNGDVFDFRWTTLPGIEASLTAAEEWLRALVESFPGCEFYYVLGNHDGIEPFAQRLDAIAAEADNFSWHPAYLRLGTALFLHGDLASGSRGGDPFTRRLIPAEWIRGRWWTLAYRACILARVHRGVATIHGAKRTVRKILRALERNGSETMHGVTDIYFGHTHLPLTGYRHRAIRFHNTGSAVRRLRWNMLPVRVRCTEDALR